MKRRNVASWLQKCSQKTRPLCRAQEQEQVESLNKRPNHLPLAHQMVAQVWRPLLDVGLALRTWLAGIIGLVLISCSTTESLVRPPQIDGDSLPSADKIDAVSKQSKSEKESFSYWLKYRRALLDQEKNPSESCRLFTELADEPRFPLAPLAQLRQYEACHHDRENLALELSQYEKKWPWLKETALQVAWQISDKYKNWPSLMIYSYERSKEVTHWPIKVELMELAVNLAQKINVPTLLEEYKARLYKLSPSRHPQPTKKDWLKVAYDYRRRRLFDKARRYYQKVSSDSKQPYESRVKALKGIRIAYKLERDKEKYVNATNNLAKFVQHYFEKNPNRRSYQKDFHDIQLMYSRTVWTEGHVRKAVRILKNTERKLKGHYPLAEVYWIRARIEEEAGNFLGALKWLNRAKRGLSPRSPLREQVLWSKAWNLRKVRRYNGAIALLDQLKEETDSPFDKAQFSFWLAKSYKDLGDLESSQDEFSWLISEDPIGYYGLLAHRELNRPLPPIHATQPDLLDDQENLSPQQTVFNENSRVLLDWLLATGEKKAAQDYLDHIGKKANGDKYSKQAWTEFLNASARAGSYLGLFIQLGRLEPEVRQQILNENPHLLFPRPYTDHVDGAAYRYGVSRELIYSIMRQESAFDETARSSADAFGLMQLLPEVAQVWSQEFRIPFKKPDDLFLPQVNIPLGSAYLKQLWDRYNGQFILAVASYNASEKAINGWLASRYQGDSLEFIEDIPYEETRAYVKLVMRNLIFYKRLYSTHPIPFPEWCLEIRPQDKT